METVPSNFTKSDLWYIFNNRSNFALGNNLWVAETDEISWQFIMSSSCITFCIWDIWNVKFEAFIVVMMKSQTFIIVCLFATATDSLEKPVASFSTLQMQTTCSRNWTIYLHCHLEPHQMTIKKNKNNHYHFNQQWRDSATGAFKDHQQQPQQPPQRRENSTGTFKDHQ